MATINTHGLNIKGLRKASGATGNWPTRSGGHTQIAYDRATGEVLLSDHVGQSWTQYDDPNIVIICQTSKHMTMQQIADRIAEAMA